MKTIGLIGGMSWESTVEYYRIINEAVKERLGGLHSAKCLLYSVDFAEIEALQRQGDWDALTEAMVQAAESLKAGGADFVVICTNTMHKVAGAVAERSGMPVLHIGEVTGEKIRERKMRTVGLLGTRFTMEGDFYRAVLKQQFDIDVVIPDEADRQAVHDVIYGELCRGIIREESRQVYQTIIRKLQEQGAEGIVLGCTEIPLLIKQQDCRLPVFDTTALHASAAVDWALD